MATSNNDRISSARLLDTLKGLQASRHLGSEPEVVTETIEYPAKVRPVAGTYPNTEQGLLDMLSDSAIDVEHNLPVKVYGLVTRDANGFTVPEKSGEPLATLDVVSKVDGLTVISDIEITSEMINNQPITGHYFMLNSNNLGYGCFYEKAGLTNANTMHVWETTASTETTTTKTKRTIKQDYVPNADWSVNDPDADGYVEGRTHWVEMGITDIQQEDPSENMKLTSFGVPYGYSSADDEWYPDFDAVETNFQGLPMYILAINENDEQITVFNENVLTNAKNYLIIMDYSSISGAGATAIAVAKNPISSLRMYGEEVHKLDRKYYDYTEPIDTEQFARISELNQYATKSSLNEYAKKDTVVTKKGVLVPSWNEGYIKGIRENGFTIKLKTDDSGWISDAEFSENNFITYNVIEALYNHTYYKPNYGGFTDANYNVLLWLVRTYGCTVNGVRYAPDSEECQTLTFGDTHFNVNGTGTPNAEMTIYVNRVAYNSIFNQNSKPTEVKSTIGRSIVNDCSIFLERILRTNYDLCGIECYLSLKYNSTLRFNNDFVLIYNMPMLSPSATANLNIGVLDETVTIGNNQVQIVAGLDRFFGGTRNTFAVFARVLGNKEDLPTNRVTEKLLLTNLTDTVPSALESYFQGR